MSGGWGQALFSAAQRPDKGQRAQTEAEEAPAEHEEELLPSEGDGALAQFAREVVESPSLEIFQTRLDVVLCSLLWVTLLGQGVGLGDPQRSLPTPTMLWFCGYAPLSRLVLRSAVNWYQCWHWASCIQWYFIDCRTLERRLLCMER